MDNLTAKQQRFIKEYLLDLNATQAAIRAGYSKKTAQEQGSRLLSNVMVSSAIQEAQQEALKRLDMSKDDVGAMYLEAYNKAEELGQPSAMVSATNGLCKLYGVNAPEKSIIENKGAMPVTVIETEYVEAKSLAEQLE